MLGYVALHCPHTQCNTDIHFIPGNLSWLNIDMYLRRAGLGDLETGVRARSDERGLSLHQGFHVGQLEVSQVFPWIFLG